MKKTAKTSNGKILSSVISGVTTDLLLILALSVLAAVLIKGQVIDESRISLLANGIVLVGAFCGAAAAMSGTKKWITSLITAGAIVLTHMLAGQLVFGSGFEGVAIHVGMVILGCASVMLLRGIPKKRIGKRKMKYAFR